MCIAVCQSDFESKVTPTQANIRRMMILGWSFVVVNIDGY
jgi:hypothetical protein